jgi:polysaccharide export outer membrane protein
MGKHGFYIVIIICVFCSSCISTNDLIYLQKKDNTTLVPTITTVLSKPYRLQINDILSISIKASDTKLVSIFSTSIGEASFSKSQAGLYFDGFTVDDHGKIRIPVLGEINVIGYTLEEVRLTIEKQLSDEYFNKEANIFVIVKLAGFQYTINGEVGNPGSKVLFQQEVTILEAIANAGDITITGNRKTVTIIRKKSTGFEVHEIDLTNRNVLQSPYFYLQPNDYVYIKPLKQKSWGSGKTGLESLGTVVTLLSLVATTFLLIKK